jgi:tetratricopeptide (TPR) repeat protein
MRQFKQFLCVALASSFALVLQVPAGAQLIQDPDAVAAVEKGVAQLDAEQWEEAIASFTEAIGHDSTFAEAFLGLADALRALEDYQAAIINYRQALDINPKLAMAFNGRGVCYRELGEFNLANNDFDNASQLDRKNGEIAANYGDILAQYGQDPVQAMRYLDIAIEQDPKNAKALRNRGLVRAKLKEYDKAIEDLKMSIEVDSDDFETYTTLASVHISQEDYVPAIDALSQAIKTYEPKENSDPETFINGYLQRASLAIALAKLDETTELKKQELYESAIADSNAVLKEFPDRYPESGLALFRRGSALRFQGKLGEAIKSFTEAIQLAPAGEVGSYISEAYLKRGICWHYQEQGSLARGDLAQSASINFEDPLPHLWIGFTYAQEGKFREAIDHYGEAISRNASFPLVYVNRGKAYMQLKQYKKGVQNFNEAIRTEPNEIAMARHFYRRGIAHMRLEEYQKAFDSFHLATLNDKSFKPAMQKKAEALRKLGKPGLAEQYDRQAREPSPPKPVAPS